MPRHPTVAFPAVGNPAASRATDIGLCRLSRERFPWAAGIAPGSAASPAARLIYSPSVRISRSRSVLLSPTYQESAVGERDTLASEAPPRSAKGTPLPRAGSRTCLAVLGPTAGPHA